MARTAVVIALILPLALPVAADWLVTRDGTRVETRGAWETRGRLVVFTLANGTLSSLRADQVDLEASEEATQEARKVAERPAAEPAASESSAPETPRRRITTADIGRGVVVVPVTEATDGSTDSVEDAGSATAPEPAGGLVILSSQEEETFDNHIRISGTVRNDSDSTMLGAGVVVFLQDRDGALAAQGPAQLSATALTPGAEASFTVDFPDVFTYASLAFQPQGTRVETGSAVDDEAGDADGTAIEGER